MGRPLYSQSYPRPEIVLRSTTPPPVVNPVYEKWTYWNPFDPDSDEFFENDAVYEAFVDFPSPTNHPPTIIQMPTGMDSGDSTPTSSGSPVSVGTDDPARMLPDVFPDYWPLQQPSVAAPAPDAPSQLPSTTNVPPDPQPRSLPATVRPRSATITVLPQLRSTYSNQAIFDGLPRTSNITPINIPSRTTVIPNLPSQQPRILSWATALPPPSPTPAPVSPPSSLPGGPLTNPNARMSLAHITPTLIRVRDVVI